MKIKQNLILILLSIFLFLLPLQTQAQEDDFQNYMDSINSLVENYMGNFEKDYKQWLKDEEEWEKITLDRASTKKTEVKKKKQEDVTVKTENKVSQEVKTENNVNKEETVEIENKITNKTENIKIEENTKEEKNDFAKPILDKYRFSSKFGYRIHPIFKVKKFHPGVDLACPKGTEVFSILPGKVLHSSTSKSYGEFIIILHEGKKSVYAHLSKRLVNKDEEVLKGQNIGLVGSTGRSTGPHLHFEIIENNEKVDPQKYIDL